MHSAGKPRVKDDRCVGCGICAKNCAHGAITLADGKANINHNICVGCGRCIGECPKDAVLAANDESNDILNCKIAEYTYAVVKDRPNFHINFVLDVSPSCDCHPYNDAPIVPNVGIFASFDPVALDMACAEAVNGQPIVQSSTLGQSEYDLGDHFKNVHPDTNWMSTIDHGAKIGLGSKEYELIKI